MVRAVCGAVGAAMLMAAAPLQAAEQTVEVTGSRLSGAQAEPASPVLVIQRDELQRSGAGSLREIIEQLPAAGGGMSDIGGNVSFAAGASGASLRNLGKQSTLLLLNGRRLPPYPLADYNEVFTNVDSLPFNAAERVEVLMIGGAAVYGSEAVAGVINVITKAGWSGAKASVSHQRSLTSGHYRNSTASVTAGWGDDSQWLAHLELYEREGTVWRDLMAYVRPEAAQRSASYGTLSSYGYPGNVVGSGPVPGCAPELLIGGLCRYDRFARFQVEPEAHRATLLLDGRNNLGGGQRAFTELLLARTQTIYVNAFQPYGPGQSPITWANPQTNAIQTFTFRGLPAGHPLNPTGQDDVDFRYRFVDGPNGSTATTLQYRALAGWAGPWKDQEWEVAAGVMGGRTNFDQQGWWSLSGFHDVIGNDDPSQTDPQFFNRAYRIGQPNSQAVINRLFPHYGYIGHARYTFADGRLSGPATLPLLGVVQTALGAELRHEQFSVSPSDALRTGDIVGNGMSASDGTRMVASAYGELEWPLANQLALQVAARVDKFQGVEAHASPKLALRWQPVRALLVRATVETGFRAPNLPETSDSAKVSYDGLNDPLRCPQARQLANDLNAAANALPASDANAALLRARADLVLANECSGNVVAITRQNPGLLPERSRSGNVGLVLAPGREWKLSMDHWRIERFGEIGQLGTSELLRNEAAQPPGAVQRAPLDANDRSFTAAEQARYGVHVGAAKATNGGFINAGRTRTGGVDVGARWQGSAGPAALQVHLDATYLLSFKAWSATYTRWGDNLAGRGYPRWKFALGSTAQLGIWQMGLHASGQTATTMQGDFYDTTYTAENCVALGYSASDCRTAGSVRWDGTLGLKLGTQFGLQAHVYNLFRHREPVAWAGWLSGGGILPPSGEDPKGRMLRVTLEGKF